MEPLLGYIFHLAYVTQPKLGLILMTVLISPPPHPKHTPHHAAATTTLNAYANLGS